MKLNLLFLLVWLPFAAGAFSFVPPQIPGWEQDGDVEIFTGDNLFDHIDGAAEFYLSYNFQKLWVVRYKKGEAEIALEVYDHGDPVHAYGVYSMERPNGAHVTAIGAQGYFEESLLNFVTGRYYVKMNSFREPDAGSGVLLSTAKDLSPQLEENPELPAIVRLMPAGNMVPNSCQFVPNTFMGLEFLGSAFQASYETGDGKLTLFVMERKSPDEAAVLLQKYHEFVQSDPGELKEGSYVIEDPFNGTIHLYWKDHYIIGFSGDDLPAVRESLLETMKSKLFN
jgi:hypothetical protein